MPDKDHKNRIPRVMDVATYYQRFRPDEACRDTSNSSAGADTSNGSIVVLAIRKAKH